MLENEIETKIVKYAKSQNVLSFKMNSVTSKGLPDRMFISKTSIFFIEFKRLGAKPTKLQSYMMSELKDYNCKVYVVDDVEQGKRIIDEYSNKNYESDWGSSVTIKDVYVKSGNY